jgi:UDP-N-acetylglucosamine 2-epimerase
MANKVAIFCGREHHWKRLSNIATELSRRGSEIFYYISDNAWNQDPSSVYMVQHNQPFKHSLDYFDPQVMPTVNKTVQDTLQSLRPTTFETDIFSFIAPHIVVFSVREFSEFIISTFKMLTVEKPDVVLILHANNAWCRALAYLCSVLKIKCISFQEGLLRHRDQETQGKQSTAADYSTNLCVWSEGSKKAYIQAGIPEDKIVVTGMAHLDPFIEKWKSVNKQQFIYSFGFDPNRPLITFGMPQLGRFEGDPNMNLNALADWASLNMMQVCIRPHPFESSNTISQLRNGLKQHVTIQVVTAGETTDLLACSDIVLTQHSTVSVEAIAMGTPVAELALDNSFILQSLADQEVAINIKSGELDKLKQMLRGELKVNPVKLESWKAENIGPLDGHSTDRVVELVMNEH